MAVSTLVGGLSLAAGVLGLSHFFVAWRFVRDEAGDGLAANWIAAAGMWFTSVVAMLIMWGVAGNIVFSPWAMLGGAVWQMGNIGLFFVFRTLGAGLAVLIFSIVTLLFGWLCGRFGIYIHQEMIPRPVLNYVGVGLAIVALVLFFLVKPRVQESEASFSKAVQLRRKVFGMLLAAVTGLCGGFNTLPIVKESEKTGNRQVLYIFSWSCGAFFLATIAMLCYSIIARNRPFLNEKLFIKSLLIGGLFAVTQCAVFSATDALQVVTALPIVVLVPALITTLYSIFLFKEIQGRRNLLILAVAFALTTGGTVMIALSRA